MIGRRAVVAFQVKDVIDVFARYFWSPLLNSGCGDLHEQTGCLFTFFLGAANCERQRKVNVQTKLVEAELVEVTLAGAAFLDEVEKSVWRLTGWSGFRFGPSRSK